MTRLAHALSIKSGESRIASLMIGIMLVTALGAALGGTGIEALFFSTIYRGHSDRCTACSINQTQLVISSVMAWKRNPQLPDRHSDLGNCRCGL
jgi:hypothetical protein